ncbi:COPII coat Sec23p-Sfb3p heterodimer component, partial [Pichia californica]
MSSQNQNSNQHQFNNISNSSPQLGESSRNNILNQQNQNNISDPNNDLFNINQSSITNDLSISSIRDQMNEEYKYNSFLSFQQVSPPISGTQYKSIDQGNSIPQFSRLSMYSVPYSNELKDKTKIPLALCLRPFAEFVPKSEIPLKIPQIKIEEGEIVPRCKRCRAYLNPAMQHTDRLMTCNICGFSSSIPDNYLSTISNGIRDDYHIRPELHSGIVDYIVPKEYNLNEDEDNHCLNKLFLIDISHNSYNSKLIEAIISSIRLSIYKDDGTSNLPKGCKISIVTFDNHLQFYKLSPNLDQTTVSIVTDLDDPFIPFNDGIFVDPIESFNIIDLTLNTIEQNDRYITPEPSFGAALKVSGMLLGELGGGQIISFLSTLPSYGPGALTLKNSNGKQDVDFIKEILTPNNKFYENLTNEFVKNNVGVNMFIASNINVDLINLATFALNTGGTIKEWLPFNIERDEISLIYEVKKVVENIAGYQGQLKVRCSRGLQVDKYYGPFSTVNGDSAPNIPILSGDTSIICEFSYESELDTKQDVHFQTALLYTSVDGIRKVRVINNIMSVTQRISDVFDFCDQDTIVKIMVKKVVEKAKTSTLVALKSTLIMQCSEIIASYKHFIAKHNSMPSQLILPQSLRALPMLILSILKTKGFTNKVHFPDIRVESLFKLSHYDLNKLSVYLYPYLYCIHTLEENDFIKNEETGLINLPKSIPLSVANLGFGGAYLVYNCNKIIIWLHNDVNVLLLKDLFGDHIDSFNKLTPFISQLPILETHISLQVRNMCEYLSKHFNGTEKQSIEICRFRVDPSEREFQKMFVEDKSEDLVWSYAEFLKEIHKNIETKAGNIHNNMMKQTSSKTCISFIVLLLATLSNALDLVVGDKDSVCDAATEIINGIMDYYEGIRYGGTVGMFQAPYYWWEAGEIFGGMIDTWAWCNNDTYEDIIYNALIAQKGSSNDYVPANQSTTEGNDDQAFWGLTVMEAAERNFTNPPDGEVGWLALSQGVYNTMLSRWDDTQCGGGLRWQIFPYNSGYDYKNTISNACLFAMAARLARYTDNDTYVSTAEMVWDWLVDVDFIQNSTSGYNIYDGANIGTNECGTIQANTWSYNYGLLISGAAYLYNYTGEDLWLERIDNIYLSIESTFINSSTGIMYEHMCQQSGNCNTDQRSFKSIFSRSLGQVAVLVQSYQQKIMDILDTSASGAASSCSGGSDGHTCGINWSYGSWDGWYGLGEQISALEVIQNTLVLQVPPPLSNTTGGTSVGDVNAGLNSRETTNENEITVTSKDKAGAGVLTAI